MQASAAPTPTKPTTTTTTTPSTAAAQMPGSTGQSTPIKGSGTSTPMTGETTPDLKGMGDQLAENLERVGSAVSTPVKGSNGSGKVSEIPAPVASLNLVYQSGH